VRWAPSPGGSGELQAVKLAELRAAIQVPAEEVSDRLEKKYAAMGKGIVADAVGLVRLKF
jgi:hypothetical protein